MNKAVKYIEDTKGELDKVTWPTRKKVLDIFTFVMFVMIVISFYIMGLDVVFVNLMSILGSLT